MARWVQEYADVLLRLVLGYPRAEPDGVLDCGGQVVHLNVESDCIPWVPGLGGHTGAWKSLAR